jgi:hypothetical protein
MFQSIFFFHAEACDKHTQDYVEGYFGAYGQQQSPKFLLSATPLYLSHLKIKHVILELF